MLRSRRHPVETQTVKYLRYSSEFLVFKEKCSSDFCINLTCDCFRPADAVCVYLSDVVLVQASLQSDPGLGLQVGDLLDDLEDVGHLFDGDHLLVPQAHPQVAHAFDGRLDVRLLVRLHVDVTFDVIRGDHRLDLQRL